MNVVEEGDDVAEGGREVQRRKDVVGKDGQDETGEMLWMW